MEKTITIQFADNSTKLYYDGITYNEIKEDYEQKVNRKILGVKVNNEIIPLHLKAKDNTKVEFFDVSDVNGYKMNQAGFKFVLEVALKETFGSSYEVIYDHSIDSGLHMTISGDKTFDNEETVKLKTAMQQLISKNERFLPLNVAKKEAIKYFEKTNNHEKAMNIHNVTNDIISVYRLKNYINYFYTEMPYSTKDLNQFDLVCLKPNKLVLLFPTKKELDIVPSYVNYESVIECFEEGKKWLNDLNLSYLSNLNEWVSFGKTEDLIRISEIYYENQIHDIVEDIIKRGSKFIMLAGPSSSGKTTSTKKLALALKTRGYDPLILSVDDYFKNRVDNPKKEDGTYDFESLEALELDLLNDHLKRLQNGEEVDIPKYNFISGEKEYDNNFTKLGEKGIILMEGLHCINDAMTKDIPNDLKYKIYLSPFIPLNIDKHNYVSTADLRLIRRMVRDNRTRGKDVSFTIAYWHNVRSGEEEYIFPYINGADKVLNTSLLYEIGVLKVYAEPLLYSVSIDSPYYEEARRLINFMKGFFPISSDNISKDSIIREFIGGSSFE
ncbi:MAG: nucleoside kinase [Bacilli bacterium]